MGSPLSFRFHSCLPHCFIHLALAASSFLTSFSPASFCSWDSWMSADSLSISCSKALPYNSWTALWVIFLSFPRASSWCSRAWGQCVWCCTSNEDRLSPAERLLLFSLPAIRAFFYPWTRNAGWDLANSDPLIQRRCTYAYRGCRNAGSYQAAREGGTRWH